MGGIGLVCWRPRHPSHLPSPPPLPALFLSFLHCSRAADELDLLAQIARASGILLDPVYTIKGALGLLTSLQEHPEMFRGRKVVFVHTGGIHGLYDGRITAHMGGKEHPTIAARAESK